MAKPLSARLAVLVDEDLSDEAHMEAVRKLYEQFDELMELMDVEALAGMLYEMEAEATLCGYESAGEEIEAGKCRSKDPEHCRVHGTPREKRMKPAKQAANGKLEKIDPSLPLDEQERRLKEMIAHMMERGGSCYRAIHREDLGYIWLESGREGLGANRAKKRGLPEGFGGWSLKHALRDGHGTSSDALASVLLNGDISIGKTVAAITGDYDSRSYKVVLFKVSQGPWRLKTFTRDHSK